METQNFTIDTITERSGGNTQDQSGKVTMGKYTLFLESPQGTWNPTTNGIVLGELLAQEDFTGQRVLELGTGVGLHAIVIAAQGAKHITVTEIDEETLAVAKKNIEKYKEELGFQTEFEYVVADWTDLPDKTVQFDTIVTNPPFAIAVRDHKKPYLHWFWDRYVEDAHLFVRPGGNFFGVHTSMANLERTRQKLQDAKMRITRIHGKEAPFRDYYFQDAETEEGQLSRYMQYVFSLPNNCFSVAHGEVPKTELQKKFTKWQHYELVTAFKAQLAAEE